MKYAYLGRRSHMFMSYDIHKTIKLRTFLILKNRRLKQ